MLELLQKWLTNRLGLVIDTTPKHFVEQIQDGKILAKLLHNYNVIGNEEFEELNRNDDDPPIILYNHLNNWLKQIGLCYDDWQLDQIANGLSEELAFNLFFELYIELSTKDSTYYASRQQTNRDAPKTQSKFQVTSVKASLFDNNRGGIVKDNPLGQPIVASWDTISWHRNHFNSLRNKCKETSERYRQYLIDTRKSNVTTINDELFIDSSAGDNPTTDAKKNLLELYCRNLKDPAKSKAILNQIRNRKDKERTRQYVMALLQKDLFNNLLESLEDDQEQFFDKTIARKLIKQSNFEKELILRMFQVQRQKEIMLENRRVADEALLRERDDQFVRELFLQSDDKLEFYLETERNLELHRHLYQQNLQLKADKRREFCRQIVEDIANVAVQHAEHHDEFQLAPSNSLRTDWGILFVKDHISGEINDVNSDDDDVLDQHDFDVYLNIASLDHINYGLNILGYVVHRLLADKYIPLPPSVPIRPHLCQIEYAVSLNGLFDPSVMDQLRDLLKPNNLNVVCIEECLNFCLDAYKAETSDQPRDFTELDSDNQQQQLDKEIQTRLEDIMLSRKAELGGLAYEQIHSGSVLFDPSLMIDMFMEYIEALSINNHSNGWVLMNYPDTIEEVAVFEEEHTAVKISTEYYDPNPNVLFEDPKLSKLLPNPWPYHDPPYQSYLNGYIQIVEFDEEFEQQKLADQLAKERCLMLEEEKTATLKDDEDKGVNGSQIPNNKDIVMKFYSESNTFYSLTYKEINQQAIKDIVKFITLLPKKPIVEILVVEEEKTKEKPKKGKGKKKGKDSKKSKKSKDKKSKSSTKKKDKKSKSSKSSGKKGKKGKNKKGAAQEPTILTKDDKVTQIPSVPSIIVDPKIYEPGEIGYTYTHHLSIANDLTITLASFWETTESAYIENMKQTFATKRITANTITPYLSNIKKELLEFMMARPPIDQSVDLQQFYDIFNEFDREQDEDAQNELRCRLDEFKENLCEMCDLRMKENETKREQLIESSITNKWYSDLIKILSSNSLTGYQIELDRYVHSLQLLNDYYTTMILTKPNPKIRFNRIDRLDDNRLTLDENFRKSCEFIDETERLATVVADDLMHAILIPEIGKGRVKKKTGIKSQIDNNDLLARLFREWNCARLGERERVTLHLDVMRSETITLIDACAVQFAQYVDDMRDEIRGKYAQELEQVARLCQVLEIVMEIVEDVTAVVPVSVIKTSSSSQGKM